MQPVNHSTPLSSTCLVKVSPSLKEPKRYFFHRIYVNNRTPCQLQEKFMNLVWVTKCWWLRLRNDFTHTWRENSSLCSCHFLSEHAEWMKELWGNISATEKAKKQGSGGWGRKGQEMPATNPRHFTQCPWADIIPNACMPLGQQEAMSLNIDNPWQDQKFEFSFISSKWPKILFKKILFKISREFKFL